MNATLKDVQDIARAYEAMEQHIKAVGESVGTGCLSLMIASFTRLMSTQTRMSFPSAFGTTTNGKTHMSLVSPLVPSP